MRFVLQSDVFRSASRLKCRHTTVLCPRSGGGAGSASCSHHLSRSCTVNSGDGAVSATRVRASTGSTLSARRRARTPLQLSKRSTAAVQQEEHLIVQSILLSWFAASNRSQFAAQCFVESVVVAYRQGLTIDELKVNITLYCAALQQLPQWPQQEAVLTSWVAIVMLTLYLVGLDPASSSRTKQQIASLSKDTLGLMKYVKQNLQMFDEGNTLANVAAMQQAANQASSPAPSGFTMLMQQYTMLVFTTLEVLSLSNLHCSTPLEDATLLPSLTPFTSLNPHTSSKATPALSARTRATAVQLLISFMGAVLGQPFSMKCFVELVLGAYQQGWRASEVVAQLAQEEFDQTGGFATLGMSLYQGSAITKQLFSRWLSIAYMTFAQLGVYHPGAQFQVGWAWAGQGDEVEANRLADFVSGAILRTARESGDPLLAEEAEQVANRLASQLQAIPELAQQLEKAQREAVQVLEDGSVLLRNKEAPMITSVEDESLASSSSVVRVMSQQVELVATAWRLVQAYRAPQLAAAVVEE